MQEIKWTDEQLKRLLIITAQQCLRVPVLTSWKRAENILNSACSLIAECYAHKPHERHSRIHVKYADPGWTVTMQTGRRIYSHICRDDESIYYNNAARLAILRHFIGVCKEEHESIYPTKTPAEELKEKLIGEMRSGPIERIIDQYEIRRRN